MQFLLTILQIKPNLVLSPPLNRANRVPGCLTSNYAEYSFQSTSRSGEYSSWLPHLRLSRIKFSVHLLIRQIEFLVALPLIVLNLVLSLLPDRVNTVPGYITLD